MGQDRVIDPAVFNCCIMNHSEQINQCIEALCNTGCDTVRATIRTLEEGLPLPQTKGLNKEERRIVLEEIKAVMAVYDSVRE